MSKLRKFLKTLYDVNPFFAFKNMFDFATGKHPVPMDSKFNVYKNFDRRENRKVLMVVSVPDYLDNDIQKNITQNISAKFNALHLQTINQDIFFALEDIKEDFNQYALADDWESAQIKRADQYTVDTISIHELMGMPEYRAGESVAMANFTLAQSYHRRDHVPSEAQKVEPVSFTITCYRRVG